MRRNRFMKSGKGDEGRVSSDDQECNNPGCLRRVMHALKYKKHKKRVSFYGNPQTTLFQKQELEQLVGGSERRRVVVGARYSPSTKKRTLKSRIKVFSRILNCMKQYSGFSQRQLQRNYTLQPLEPSDRRPDKIWKNKKSEVVFLTGILDSIDADKLRNDADISKSVNGEKGLLQEVIGNGDDSSKMSLDVVPDFSRKERFTKSGSYPTTDMSRRMNFSASKMANKINEIWVSPEGGSQSLNNIIKYKEHLRAKSWHITSDREEMPIDKKVGQLFLSLKPELNYQEKTKEIASPEEFQQNIHHEILDKSEASKKLFLKSVFDEHPRERHDEKDPKWCIELGENSEVKRAFIHRKSYSLSDSLERYFRLLEFISQQEIKLHSSKSLRLRNEYDPPSTNDVSFKRKLSPSHLDSYYSIQIDEQENTQLASRSLETVAGNKSFVEGNSNDEEQHNATESISTETEEKPGYANSLDGETSIYISNLQEIADNKITVRTKEENANCPENTAEYFSIPIQDSNAEALEGKNGKHDYDACSSDMYYVRELLARSSFYKDISNGIWLPAEKTLINDITFKEMEADWHQEVENKKDVTSGGCTHHRLLFDIVNEVLLHLHDRPSMFYPKALSSSCYLHPKIVGSRIDEEIIATTNSFLSRKGTHNQPVDAFVHGDLSRYDGWMNLISESRCLAKELEDILADDLLEELLFGDLLELH
ncbi:hypothetical protein LIER_18644 [Lithospermum erythrorhizon]|uniref:DUF4378 domain-containing protein n=1 Tax=Lithospermum erythrorhizon TaxID=34254 RepID=A0AAV3QEX8_LITER